MVCHCGDCQKLTASAFSLTAMFTADSVSFTGAMVRGGLRSAQRAHFYCASCLGFVYSQIAAAPERVNIRTSLLAQPERFEPFLEVMDIDKLPWAHLSGHRSYETRPESLEELTSLFEEYAQLLDQ